MAVNSNNTARCASPQVAMSLAWLLPPTLALAFLLAWLQRSLWLNQCPGQIGWNCESSWGDLQKIFVIEILLCVGVAVVGLVDGVLHAKRMGGFVRRRCRQGQCVPGCPRREVSAELAA